MENLTYVTVNYGKYCSVKQYFEKYSIDINYYNYDLEEPTINNIEFISREKAKKAYELVKSPCFVADAGFYIDAYPNNPGYPGAFVKRSGIAKNIEDLLNTMKNVNNRNCKFIDCLTFYNGSDFYTFYGVSKGTLAYSKRGDNSSVAKSNLWYIFIPNNCTKTLAEMSKEERLNRNDGRTSATEQFINWYKETYIEKLNKAHIYKTILKPTNENTIIHNDNDFIDR